MSHHCEGGGRRKENVPQPQARVVSMADHLLPQAFGILALCLSGDS